MSDFNNSGDIRRPNTRRNMPSTRTLLGITFGLFMVVIYVGMGVLLCINFFNWGPDWAWCRWIVGVVLVIYGFFRAWRTYKTVSQKDSDQ